MQSNVIVITSDSTANYTYTTNMVDCTNGNINISFGKISDYYGDGSHFYVIKTDATANTITLVPYSGETLNNLSTYVMPTSHIHIMCFGTNWYILSE